MITVKSQPLFPIKTRKTEVYIDPDKRRNRFGRMTFQHKTAGEICVMTKEQFEDFKSYEPTRCGRSSIKTRSKTTGGDSGGLGGI